jgi:hypothetical protein
MQQTGDYPRQPYAGADAVPSTPYNHGKYDSPQGGNRVGGVLLGTGHEATPLAMVFSRMERLAGQLMDARSAAGEIAQTLAGEVPPMPQDSNKPRPVAPAGTFGTMIDHIDNMIEMAAQANYNLNRVKAVL